MFLWLAMFHPDCLFTLSTSVCCEAIFDIHYDGSYNEHAFRTNYIKLTAFGLDFLLILWLVFSYSTVIFRLAQKSKKVSQSPTALTNNQQQQEGTVGTQNEGTKKRQERKRKRTLKMNLQFATVTVSFILLTVVWFVDHLQGHSIATLYLQRLGYCLNCMAPSLVFFCVERESSSGLWSVLRI